MNLRTKNSNLKSKTDLIENINQKFSEPQRITKKITRQTQIFTKNNVENFREALSKNPKSKFKADWNKIEYEVKQVLIQWQKKQIPEIIDQFLEEIKFNLKSKNDVVLKKHFSLKVYKSLPRKTRNPQTGKEMIVKEKNRISFRTSSNLKKEIN